MASLDAWQRIFSPTEGDPLLARPARSRWRFAFERPRTVRGLAVAIPGEAAVLHGEICYLERFLPNSLFYTNPKGASQTISTNPRGIDTANRFFQSLGQNGRTCVSCHQPSNGMSLSAANVN